MNIKFELVGISNFILDIDGKFKIGCDPILAAEGTKYDVQGFTLERVKGPVYDENTFNNVKIWLLTHLHPDHLDELGFSKIESDSYVVSNKNCEPVVANHNKLTYLEWKETTTFEIDGYKINITAVPAFHGMDESAIQIMGNVNGYLVELNHENETKTIYMTSDTVFKDEVIEFLKNKKIDILIPNLGAIYSTMQGGPFTMNISMLNQFINKLNPKLTLPIHINDFAHYETSFDEVKALESDMLKVLENGMSFEIK